MTTNISAPSTTALPESHHRMGTIRFPGGIAFRVWAPFASEVFVAGTFNQWSKSDNPFFNEGNGCWYTRPPANLKYASCNSLIYRVRLESKIEFCRRSNKITGAFPKSRSNNTCRLERKNMLSQHVPTTGFVVCS